MTDDLATQRQLQRQEINDLRESYCCGLGDSPHYIVPKTPVGKEVEKSNSGLVKITQKGHAMKGKEGTLLQMKYPGGMHFIQLEDGRPYAFWESKKGNLPFEYL